MQKKILSKVPIATFKFLRSFSDLHHIRLQNDSPTVRKTVRWKVASTAHLGGKPIRQ